MASNTNRWTPPKLVESIHKNDIVEIGMKLERLRDIDGYSASRLANELSISRNAYRQMERGEIYFSLYNFLKILNHYNIDLKTFISTPLENDIFQIKKEKK